MIIYIDELFIKNFIMTYLILVITAEVLSIKYQKKYLLLGSLLSSLITIFALIYEVDNLIITRITTITLMILVSFRPKEMINFLMEITFILAITFLIGGVMNSQMNNFVEVILCGVVSIFALKKYNEYYKKKKWKIRNKYKLKLEIENSQMELNAFLDTGNFLTTNFKEEPVIVISKEVIKDKVSKEILDLLLNGEIGNLTFSTLKNIRPINYLVLNETMKMTYGLKVKNIKIESEKCEIIKDAVIIISENKINNCDAIIGLSLLEGGIENGNATNIKTESKEVIC